MTVTSKRKAWQAADAIMPTDYEKDEARTAGAGYPIYYSTADGVNAYICDLGDRLEVNLPDGSSVNIWIKTEPEHGDASPVDAVVCDGVSAEKLIDLAATAALDIWAKAEEHRKALPGNAITEARAAKAWARVEAIQRARVVKIKNGAKV